MRLLSHVIFGMASWVGAASPAVGEIRFELTGGVRDGDGATALAAGDFDEDGRGDVAVANRFSRFVSIFRSDGAGGLVRATRFYAGSEPWHIVAVDFDGDSNLDVLTADHLGEAVWIHLGDGRGGFRFVWYAEAGNRPRGIAVADFDVDGLPDVAVACNGGYLRILLGTGGGAVTAGPILFLGGLPESVAAADVTGDGLEDLVVAASYSGITWIFAGDGTGQFVPIGTVPTELGSRAVTLSDLDGDGALDLAVANPVRDAVIVALGDGASGFGPPTAYPAGDQPIWVVAAHLDFDGRIDLAAADFVSGVVSVLPGIASARGAFGAPLGVPVRRSLTAVVPLDLDGDGALDLLASDLGYGFGANVAILLNRSVDGCLAGNVNEGAGVVADVLFVNDSIGGPERTVRALTYEPLSVFVAAPPSAAASAPFALYAWREAPAPRSLPFYLPHGIGDTCLPTPLTGGSPAPRVVWNNTGSALAGTPTRPSSPAPALVVSRPSGFGRPATAFLQGIIRDRAAPNGRAAVTNGVTIEVR